MEVIVLGRYSCCQKHPALPQLYALIRGEWSALDFYCVLCEVQRRKGKVVGESRGNCLVTVSFTSVITAQNSGLLDPIMGSLTSDAVRVAWSIAKMIFNDSPFAQCLCISKTGNLLWASVASVAIDSTLVPQTYPPRPQRDYRTTAPSHSRRFCWCAGDGPLFIPTVHLVASPRGYHSIPHVHHRLEWYKGSLRARLYAG